MEQPRSATPRILLADDDDLVRAVAVRVLRKLGYDVRDFRSAPQAVAALRAGFEPDLLVSEIRMAGMSGIELAHAARAIRPDLPVLLVSAYPVGARDPASMPPGSLFLAKPFAPAELAVQVGRALAQSSRP